MSESPPDPNVSEFIDMSLLRVPRSYQCRIYVVKGMHLQPKDVNGLADPYLYFKVGLHVRRPICKKKSRAKST